MNHEKNRGVYVVNTQTVLVSWAEYMQATGASTATIRVRVQTLGSLMRHAGKTDPLTLTRRDALAFLAKPRAQWSKVTYWRCIKAWCVWLAVFEFPHEDLLKGMPTPRAPAGAARPIERVTVNALLASRMTLRTRCYVLLALYCGLRVHEIAKIRGEDFDIEAGWLTVTGKGSVTKPIPVHPEIVKLAAQWPEIGYWFPSNSAPEGHVTARAVSLTIGNALRAVGSRATAHQLRDTAATNFQRQVKDIRLTQALLRHSSLNSTMKYTAVSNSELQDAVRAIDWTAA